MIEKVNQEVEMLARHLAIFEKIIEEHPIGIVNLSQATEYPQHRVRYSLRMLENKHLIEPTSQGAVPTERAKEYMETHDERLDEVISRFNNLRAVEEMSIPE